MAVHPGSPTSSDDHVIEAIWKWQIENTRHPLIGRQLRARLTQAGFTNVRVMPIAYSSMSFEVMKFGLELDTVGQAVVSEDRWKVSNAELQSWYRAVEQAEAAGEFFSMAVLYFGLAYKRAHTGWR